jgi:cytidylate kinase
MESQAFLRSTEALARVQHHWRKRSAVARDGQTFPLRTAGFSVALTREAGVCGTAVAQEVGARLGWPVYDHEIVDKIAGETGLRIELLESVDQRHRNWLAETLEDLMDVPRVSESTYLRHLFETLLSLGAHGECVVVEHGAAQVLPHETTLRVRLIGKRQDRIRQVSRRFNLDERQAADKLEEIDNERARFIRDFFQRDVADPTFYDLLLNASHWSVPECADLIVDALHRLQQRTPAKSPRGTTERSPY